VDAGVAAGHRAPGRSPTDRGPSGSAPSCTAVAEGSRTTRGTNPDRWSRSGYRGLPESTSSRASKYRAPLASAIEALWTKAIPGCRRSWSSSSGTHRMATRPICRGGMASARYACRLVMAWPRMLAAGLGWSFVIGTRSWPAWQPRRARRRQTQWPRRRCRHRARDADSRQL